MKLTHILGSENERSNRALKNIILSFGVKGGSIIVGLMLVPLTIGYINPVQYGIWLTISSIITWLSFFDIGMGNGLRNKLTESLATENYIDARKYVSTTYAVLTIVAVGMLFLFVLINFFLDWRSILNIPSSVKENIQAVILIVLCSFCFQFVVQLINVILMAIHKAALSGLVSFLGQLALLVTIFILKVFVSGTLEVLVWALTLVPMFAMAVCSFILYKTSLKKISPSIHLIDLRYAKGILNVGGVFFFIQIGSLVLFQSNNIIITRIISPGAVTEFNVAYKLYSIIIMLFTIIMTPYWSAFTEAYTVKDYNWMKITLTKVRKIWFGIVLLIVPLTWLFSNFLFKIWIGDKVHIDPLLSVSMALYVIGYTGLVLNCFFLNGIGKLKIQLLLYLIVCVINIPLAVFLGQRYGTAGVTMSNVFMFIFMDIVLWIQSSRIINQKAGGMWNQ